MIKRAGKYISLLLILFLCSAVTISAEENKNIGLPDIIKLALEKNLSLQLADLSLEDAQLDYRKNKLNNLLSNSKVLELQSELTKAEAEKNYQDIKNSVIVDVITDYLNIISVEQQIITAQKNVKLEKKKVEEIKAKLELGYKSRLDLFDEENDSLSAENSLEKLKADLVQQRRELKQKIFAAEDIKITPVTLKEPVDWNPAREDLLKKAIANNQIMEIRQRQLLLAENDLKKAEVSGIAELDLKKKAIAFKKANIELAREKQQLNNQIVNKYSQFKQSVKNMQMAEKLLAQAKDHYQVMKEQQKAGLVSKNDLLSSELSLYQAKDSHIESVVNYYLAMLQLKEMAGLEPEVELNHD